MSTSSNPTTPISSSTDGRHFYYNQSPSTLVCTEFMLKRDSKSVILSDLLAKHGLILFREAYGYSVTDLDEELNIHFKNLFDLDKFIKRFL